MLTKINLTKGTEYKYSITSSFASITIFFRGSVRKRNKRLPQDGMNESHFKHQESHSWTKESSYIHSFLIHRITNVNI